MAKPVSGDPPPAPPQGTGGRSPAAAGATYGFGDLLALARQSWVRQMAARLRAAGHADYVRSDAAVLRLLLRGPFSVGRLGSALGVTRQAARKVADGLERRGYARIERNAHDARQLDVALSDAGREYARVMVEVIGDLNRELASRVGPADLAAADTVLRASLGDEGRARAARLVAPPAGRPARRDGPRERGPGAGG